MTVTLSLAHRAGSWFITGLADGDLGLYATRADAESDRRGVQRFYRREMPDGHAVSTENEPSREPAKQLRFTNGYA